MLDGTQTEAGWNDDLITEPEFTEALSGPGLSKDTELDLDVVKYSDIKNRSQDDTSEPLTLYEASLATGQYDATLS